MADDDIFKVFLRDDKNKVCIENMKDTLAELANGGFNMTVAFLCVKDANATSCVHFTRAVCDVMEVRENDDTDRLPVVPIGCFFAVGYAVLKNYLADKPAIPSDLLQRTALKNLIEFLSSDHSELTRENEEAVLAAKYAEHLLIPLVPQKTFLIDAYTGIDLTRCCDVEHSSAGSIGDTSYGLARGWHGEADILIMKNEEGIPLFIGQSQDDDISVSSVESRVGGKFSCNALKRMIAQTIVFSFLQHKQNLLSLNHFLIPGIGICGEKIIIHFYDCLEDVLIETLPLDIFSRRTNELHMRCVLVLWLTLNHKIFCTGVTDDLKKYKSDFHSLLGPEYLQLYMKEVTMPAHVKFGDKRAHEPDWQGTFPTKKLKPDDLPEVPTTPLDI